MQTTTLFLILGLMATAAFFLGRGRSLALVGGPVGCRNLHSLPGYYGYFTAIWCLLPALVLALLWILIEPRVITALLIDGLPGSYDSLTPGRTESASQQRA